jgi:hypothetical protein
LMSLRVWNKYCIIYLFCFCCWSGYDLEVAEDMKMEGEMDDGELEYLDEEEEYYDEEDSYGYNTYEEDASNEFAVNGKTMPMLKSQPSSSSSANNNRAREVLHVSSNCSFKNSKIYALVSSCSHSRKPHEQ